MDLGIRDDSNRYWVVWVREHGSFSVVVKVRGPYSTAVLPGWHYAWCLYVLVKKNHPSYAQLAVDRPDDPYFCDVREIVEHMHVDITYLEREQGGITVGCDFAHWGDDTFRGTSPNDSSCLVHYYAWSLESAMLELEGRPALLGPPEWAKFATLPDAASDIRDLYINKLRGDYSV